MAFPRRLGQQRHRPYNGPMVVGDQRRERAMTKRANPVTIASLLAATLAAGARASDWPQFRGPNASGRPASEAPLPAELGPDTNVLWKTPLPPGHSFPVVGGD